MAENFVSRRYSIVSSAIEIISELGLSGLTTHNLAEKENMSEALLYKYFSGIDEVLIEVVDYYFSFDERIRSTVASKEGSFVDKIKDYFDAYTTYYDNYYAISTLMLQYEELLHNIDTRDKVSTCINERREFVSGLFQGAIDAGEIVGDVSAEELSLDASGMMMSHILKRRVVYHKKTFKEEFMDNMEKWLNVLRIKD